MLSFLLASAALPNLLISRGEADMTPPEPLPLGGYTARRGALGVQGEERLTARCLYFREGSLEVALVCMEALTIPESLQEEIEKRVGPKVKIFLAATHTHSAPDSQMLNRRMNFAIPGIAPFRQRWLEWHADRVASVILNARSAVGRPLPLRLSQADAAFNRARRPNAKPIQTLTVFGSGTTAAAIYAAHATLLDDKSNRVSGDWPGAWMKRDGGPYLVLPGAIGDVSPAAEGETNEAKVRAMADGLQSVWEKSVGSELKGSLGWAEAEIRLHSPSPHPDFAKSNSIPDALAQTLVNKFAPPIAKVRVLQIGRLKLIGIPGEPTSELARQIMRAAVMDGPGTPVVVSHVGGWMGYILMPKDYDAGAYEATLAFHGRDVAARVTAAAESALSSLKKN